MKRRREARENPGIGWTPILAGIGGFAAGATLMGIAAKAATGAGSPDRGAS